MKINLKLYFLLVLIIPSFLILNSELKAQDIHFSQFESSPILLNPSLTGHFDGQYRIGTNYRSQWSSVIAPYKTIDIYFDSKLLPSKLNDKLAIGAAIFTDRAGDWQFGTTEASLSLSYALPLNSNETQFLVLGMQGGMVNRSLDFSNITFGSQFDGGSIDANLPSGETTINNSISFADFSTGLNWIYSVNEKLKLESGLAYFHVNKPDQSFYSDKQDKLQSKFVMHASSNYALSDRSTLMPRILFLRQGPHQEIDVGSLVKRKLENKNTTAIYLGGWYRFQDAVVAIIKLDYKDFSFGLSYDINVSELRKASWGRGGPELSIIYINRNLSLKNIIFNEPCPRY